MNAIVRLSMIPTDNNSLPFIYDFIGAINKIKEIKIEFNDEVTLLYGDYNDIMKIISSQVAISSVQFGATNFSLQLDFSFEQNNELL